MSNAIVITSGKGGVGKTSAAANLGAALALSGRKTALVDADMGLRNLDVVLGLENRVVYDIADVAAGTCRLKQVLIRDKRLDGLYLLPAAQAKEPFSLSRERMRSIISELKDDFDHVLIDCPAGIEQGFANAISGADSAIVVAVPEVSSVRDADRVVGLITESGISDVKLIINRYRKELVKKGDMLSEDDLVGMLGLELLATIPEDAHIFRCSNLGEPLVLKTGSRAGKAYIEAAARLSGKPNVFSDKGKKARAGGLIAKRA